MLKIQKNILLSGTMRSGTTFMSSTLDAHPKIGMVSDILNWFWSRFFPKYGDISSVYELDKALYELEYFITYGLNLKQKSLLNNGKIKKDTIEMGISSLSFYYSLIKNFHYSEIKPCVGIKATHQAKFYSNFLDYTPNSYVVHMVRNPIDSYYSHKLRTPDGKKLSFKKKLFNKLLNLNLGLNFENVFKRYYDVGLRDFTPYVYNNSIKFLDEWLSENKKTVALQKKYPDQIIIIKFEDLISDVENSLKKVFEFIDIEWNGKVLEYEKLKDRNGTQFKANSSFKKNTTKTIEIKGKSRYLTYLNKEELNYYKNNIHPFAKGIGFNIDINE